MKVVDILTEGMSTGAARHKQKISRMTDEEAREYFKTLPRDQVERMERYHVVRPGTYTKYLPSLTEGKTHKVKKPRAKELNKILRTKKGGAHYNPKTDYVRAKEKEKARRELDEGWMRHNDAQGERFSAEESDIRDHVQHTQHNVRCPKCRKPLNPKIFKRHVDQENDITHWTHTHDCGAQLTVFND